MAAIQKKLFRSIEILIGVYLALCTFDCAAKAPSEMKIDCSASIVRLEFQASFNNVLAQYCLGNAYLNGSGVRQSPSRAIIWYSKAAAQNSPDAFYALGSLYYSGVEHQGITELPVNFQKALIWYKKGAAQGDARSEQMLGTMYAMGYGVAQNYGIAKIWNQKSADQGYAPAEFGLGLMYNYGAGVSKDLSLAASWYAKGAEQGDPSAQFSLGVLYAQGSGVPKNLVAACALYDLSVARLVLLDASSYETAQHSTKGRQAFYSRSILRRLATQEQQVEGWTLARKMEKEGVIEALNVYLKSGLADH